MIKILNLLGLLVFSLSISAQQGNYWYFGSNAGLNFNNNPPSALLNGQLNTLEGCASMSDSVGNLLFYTDGITVWNRNHQSMPNGNGLKGHPSSTHSAIVIPKPGSNSIYYVFTSDAVENNGANGFRYSEIDMTLNSGTGDVTANKNILLYAPSTEKLTAASHANGIDIWVITKEYATNVYKTYLVSCTGVNTTPVVSASGTPYGPNIGYGTGSIKVSPDGTMLANARNFKGSWELFKFDNNTGIISDYLYFTQSTQIGLYGIEFSPNSKLVYVNGGYMYQYKVDAFDYNSIWNSKYQVDTLFIVHGALQLGPDGKIYNVNDADSHLSVINNPNLYGQACNYTYRSQSLNGRNCRTGLPTFFSRVLTNQNLDYTYVIQPDCKTVIFTGISTIPGNNNWNWDFGDGTFGTGQIVTHVFPTNPNVFTIRLSIGSATACAATVSRSKVISFDRFAPTSRFGYIALCDNLSISFHDSSSIQPGGNIISWQWDFGDGNSSSMQNPTHPFNAFGNYLVRLIVESSDACHTKDTSWITVNVRAKPLGFFTAPVACATKTIQFADQSTISAGVINNWYWSFGDGGNSNIQNPSHIYTAAGNYIIKLVTTSNLYCSSDTFYLNKQVGVIPVANFTMPSICLLDASANFINISTISGGGQLNYLWKFGDPNATISNPDSSLFINPSHSYSQSANYTVSLVTTSSTGCKDTIVKPFIVNGAIPRAAFKVINQDTLCSNKLIALKDSSYVNFGNITKLKIFWGDGDSIIDNSPTQVPNGKTYTHSFQWTGLPFSKSYIIRMYAYSGGVCEDISSKSITVNASPQIQFPLIGEICNEKASFILQASESSGLVGQGAFYGNGIINPSSGLFNPQILDTGYNSVRYEFISNNGCKTDSIQLVHINPTPKSNFSFNNACLPKANIQFTNLSTLPGLGSTLSYLWNFGDMNASGANTNTSTNSNTSHYYTSLDTFSVSLKTTSGRGCLHDTIIKVYPNVSIYKQPKAIFEIDSLKSICAGTPVYFINKSDSGGQLISAFNWKFGDGNLSNARNPNNLYNPYGTYTATLWIQNIKGCVSDTNTKTINVQSIPHSDFIYDTACLGKPINFIDKSTNIYGAITKWNWDFDNGVYSNIQNPMSTFQVTKMYNVSLKVQTDNGCSSNAFIKLININPVVIKAGNDTSITVGQPLQLNATGASTFIWSPNFGLSNIQIPNPILNLSYPQNQTYFLKGISNEGCVGYDTLNIKVFTDADIYVPNAFTPNGDGINDYIKPICIGIKGLELFKIYDRWGKIVFNAKSINDKWDGNSSQIYPTNSCFVWIAQGYKYDGSMIIKKGVIVLLK